MVSSGGGYAFVVGAMVFFGSFGVFLKTKRVEQAHVNPLVMQGYMCLGILLSSLLVLTYNTFFFTFWGIIAASIWVPFNILAIVAIRLIGLSVAQGLWSGMTILVSFLWGSTVFASEDKVKSIPLAIVGLLLLITGVMGLALTGSPTARRIQAFFACEGVPLHVKEGGEEEEEEELEYEQQEEGEVIECVPMEETSGRRQHMLGVALTIVMGVMNGSMMVPLRYAPDEVQEITYIVSFAFGTCIVIFGFLLVKVAYDGAFPPLHTAHAMAPGIMAGVFWNIGNFCATYATLSPLGLTIGFPLTQCALLVAGLWGIFHYQEIQGTANLVHFFTSATILLCGAILLALSKTVSG